MNSNTQNNQPNNEADNPQKQDALIALIQKLNSNPQAAEAMRQAIEKTERELNSGK